MEGDNHSGQATHKAEIDTTESEKQTLETQQEKQKQQQEGEAIFVTSPRIQFKESLPSRSSHENDRGRQRSINKRRGTSTSPPPAELGPGFAEESGDVGGHGYDETEVDIIAVPCPGADPVQTWIYDHDSSSDSNYPVEVGSHLSRNSTQTSRSHSSSIRRASPWVTLKLRERASIARVFLYRHRTLHEGMTLKSLSNDLLEQVQKIRNGASRPLFFIAHSIGGLVVKSALVRACQKTKYQNIMDDCHGVTFFGTPHRGSSYMSMPTLKNSIQDLLQLEAPLPRSLTDEILVNNSTLKELHEQFVDIASELRLWSFYETRECLLSGSGAGLTDEVQFTAPLVSVKSALLDLWQEDIFGVESDHSHLAAFGPDNEGILASYLGDLAGAIIKAAQLSQDHEHYPLYLKTHVQVEVIGFYEDPDAWISAARQYVAQNSDADVETGSVIRLYATRYPFKDFLKKGPEKCLSERLHDRSKKPRKNRSPHHNPRPPKETGDDASSIGSFQRGHTAGTGPEIIVTSGMERPSLAFLRPPVHTAPDLRPPSPESNASVSTTMSDPVFLRGRDFAGDGPLTVDMLQKQQAEIMLKEHELTATAGFSRPNPSLRKFTWIHLPFNNPVWVKEIFNTLTRTQGHDFSRLFDYDNWTSKHIQNRHSETQPAYLKPHCKYLTNTSITSPRPTPLFGPGPASLTNSPNCLYVYLPYLHFDTYHSMIKRRKIIKERRERGRAKPVPKNIADEESLELRVIWEYIGFDPPLNCRRTLDQFGHHSLRDTNSRDDDQMLYKLTKKDPLSTTKPGNNNNVNSTAKVPAGSSLYSNKGSGASDSDSANGETDAEPDAELKDGYVLMVDQLWLWSIDMTTLTTFFPRRHSTPTEGTLFHQADLRNSVYNELNGDLTGRTENALDLAALIVWHAVIVFLDRSSHPDLEIFRLFDEAIGMLAERMTLNMKQFRLLSPDSDSEENNSSETDWSDYEGESPASIKKRHRRELERSERENRENTSALLELRDLEDELTTLQKLFDNQESTIRQMRDYYLTFFRDITRNGQEYLDEALEYLDDFKQQTTEMLKRVDTTRNDYEKMLEMVQRQAQVDEVRWSRLQAELASSQNLSVMIFTTFTVIFLPLTFFTGLFGMNTIEWQEPNVPSLKTIGWISLPASATLIILSLVAAFSWRVQRSFKATYKGIKSTWKFAKGIYAERWEPVSRKEKKRRRRLERKRKHQESKSGSSSWRNEKTYDFWAMVKKQQRNMRYQIPDTNRKL
ncbi:hypothetical protein QBC35DRAFT_488885 [Podospora australis]|uniref:DUF676 domain-containing protein n=1 Tax=Podospora australis TaxID=1536484 RepID=A0AAN6WZC4_9PEZI|nr:hypothetical protein QBC35DRAFT_488885 [Podospora australis]